MGPTRLGGAQDTRRPSSLGKCADLKEAKEGKRKGKTERLEAVLVVLSGENYFGK